MEIDVLFSVPRNLWAYFQHLATLLENIGVALTGLPEVEHKWVRKGLSVRNRASSIGKKEGRERAARTMSRNVEYVTSSSGEMQSGVRREGVEWGCVRGVQCGGV